MPCCIRCRKFRKALKMKRCINFIAECVYHLVMISIDLSERTRKSALEIQDKIQSENFFFQQIFFPIKLFSRQKKICWKKNSWILSQTEFCLGLHTAVVFRMQSFNCSYLIYYTNALKILVPETIKIDYPK